MFSRPVGKQRSRAFMISVGLFGILLAALTFYVGYQAAYSVPGRGYYNLHAEFSNAENLANHYEIREGGVRVGQLLNPRVKDGKALIDMRIDDKYKPLKSDTKLRIRLRSAVGVRYLEIIPGTKGSNLPDGATIPTSQTATPVALDKVLDTFDTPTRKRTRDLLNGLGAGVLSRGTDINETIATSPKFFHTLGDFSNAIVKRNGSMARFIRASNEAADGFDPVRVQIGEGFRPERDALMPFIEKRQQVQDTLTDAGPALHTLRTDLPNVAGLLDAVDRFSTDTDPTLREAPDALTQTNRLLANAKTPLGNANRTLQLAQKAVPPTLTLLAKVRPVLAPIGTALNDLLPTLDYLGPRACDMTQFATGWAEFTKWGDEKNSFIRFLLAAVRPEQPGFATKETNVFRNFINPDPYPGPCENGIGAAGTKRPTEQESQSDQTYSSANPPGGK